MWVPRIKPRHVTRYGLMTACLLFFAVFMFWPIALTLTRGFSNESGFTLQYAQHVLRDPVLREGLLNALAIACCTTALSLVIGVPLAVAMTAYDFRGKHILAAMLLTPLILPPFVGVIGLRNILGHYGSLNSLLAGFGWIDPAHPVDFLGQARFWGIVAIESLHLYPIIYLNTSAALANIDPAMEQAAENLGASRLQRLRRITLPLTMPGLFAGATIVFIWSFTELGTPLLFDYYTVTPVQIFFSLQEAASNREPFALTAIVLLVSAAIYGLLKWGVRGRDYTMAGRSSVIRRARTLTGPRAWLLAAFPLCVALIALTPHAGVLLTSFSAPGAWHRSVLPAEWTASHYAHALSYPLVVNSIRNSLIYATAAVGLDLLIGVAIAWLVVRARVKGAALLDTLAMLPLAVPGIVMAFGYVAVSLQIGGWFAAADRSPPPWLQVLGENPNPILFLIIAYAVRRLPYVVRAAAAAFQQSGVDMEEAAQNLGAGWVYTLRRVVLPLIAANLIAGAILAFSFAMLEVSDSLVLAQTERHAPLTKAIYDLFDRLGDGPYLAAALGVWAMALLCVTLFAASALLGKKLGAIFRA